MRSSSTSTAASRIARATRSVELFRAPQNRALRRNRWKKLYGRSWPYGFEPDNFTETLRDYYGFKRVNVTDAALVIEGGEKTCPPQSRWIAAHLKWEGELIAHFVSLRLGRGRVPLPPG